jgi:hypothetical protein
MTEEESGSVEKPRRRRRVGRWIVGVALILLLGVGVAVEVVIQRAAPILKGRIVETLSTRFNSRVELDGFDVSVLKGLEVSGNGLRIFAPYDVEAAGAKDPLFSIGHFSFRTGIRELFEHPTRVDRVYVQGLEIIIPPREMRQAGAQKPKTKHRGKVEIVVDEIICEDSKLVVETLKPNKDPKVFQLEHIELRHFGPDSPLSYDATLVNAIPKGDIHATGKFGPWDTESPGDSFLDGHYIFDHGDLNTIRGIGGIVSSTGNFTGQLNEISVEGESRTPQFSLDSANHPMPLNTQFKARVDGLTGDTYLDSVTAKLGGTTFTTQGAIVNVKGKGHILDFDVDVPAGRIQDFLQLAVKTTPTVVTGVFSTKTKMHVPYGKEKFMDKMSLKGDFKLRAIHFTNPKVEDKVDMLSLRAQGDPKDAKPGAADVQSEMNGKFVLNQGKFTISKLLLTMPGAHADMDGIYTLDGEQFEFHGTVATQAKVSQMVASRWKSFLLKAVDPFFKGADGGAKIPVKISGTKSEPKFGLDLHYKDEDKINAEAEKKAAKAER